MASLIAERGPQGVGSVVVTTGLVALRHAESSPTRDHTFVPCVGRRILNHWTAGDVLLGIFLSLLFRIVRVPIQLVVYTNSLQAFWHQGLVSWKTAFPWLRGGEDGFRMIQAHYTTLIVHFISIIISPSPQIIRH